MYGEEEEPKANIGDYRIVRFQLHHEDNGRIVTKFDVEVFEHYSYVLHYSIEHAKRWNKVKQFDSEEFARKFVENMQIRIDEREIIAEYPVNTNQK